jgi:hypothetical protein
MKHDLCVSYRYKLRAYVKLAVEQSDQQNIKSLFHFTLWAVADPSGRAVKGAGLRPLACWDCWFEHRRKHGCLSSVSVVCCQVEVSASG